MKISDNSAQFLFQKIDVWRNKFNESQSTCGDRLKIIFIFIFVQFAVSRRLEHFDILKHFRNIDQIVKYILQKYHFQIFEIDQQKIKIFGIDQTEKFIEDIEQLDFPTIPIETLGYVYEYLFCTKPEIRKSGGVFYTPQYIVQYIVQKTVGKLVENKTPKEVSKIKIVDPACGSGSFLLGAYQFLLDWHKDYYSKHAKPSKGRKNDPLTPTGNLSTSEKKRILLNNIFGVDIDLNAVEVTKLSLLIKCMEGETEASVETIQRLFHEQVLPSIDDNIRDGNSLVDTDFYDNNFDFGDERNIKPFNWKLAFPHIFKQNGFDCVIGNPPYVAIDSIKQVEKEYFSSKYPYLKKRFDLFGLFVDNGIKLLNPNGKIGVIIPMQFLRNSAFELLRKSILENNHIEILNYLGGKIFKNANNDTIILVVGKNRQKDKKSTLIESITTKSNIIENKITVTDQCLFLKNNESIIDISTEEDKGIANKIENQKLKIHQRFQVLQGIVSGLNEAYIYRKNKIPKIEKQLLKPFVFGSDFEKYFIRNPQFQIIYLNKKIDLTKYPKTENLLLPFKKTLKKRREAVKNSIPWYSLQWARDQSTFEKPKIIFQKIRNQKLQQRLVGTFDNSGLFVGDGVIYLNSKTDNENELKFLLAILNSTLYNFYYRHNFLDINLKIKYLENTSIIDYTEFDIKQSKNFTDIVKLADQLLKLNAEKSETKLSPSIKHLDEKISYCENKINQIVYQLYGLTENEIKIVESDFKN
jgi:type I restriction-modification system DNA methylase subunit